MAGHLYLNCKHNGDTFALIYYYGHNETEFALNQTQRLINYIYNHYEDDYRYSAIRFVEQSGGCLASGDNNRDYAQKLFPFASFAHGSRDNGLVILKPTLIHAILFQVIYETAKQVIIDFDNDNIEWNVYHYWSNMTAFKADGTTKLLYMNNPSYSVGVYNKELNVVPFENINIVENLILDNTIVLDGSGGVFRKIEEKDDI